MEQKTPSVGSHDVDDLHGADSATGLDPLQLQLMLPAGSLGHGFQRAGASLDRAQRAGLRAFWCGFADKMR